jgi:hypothetical protein
VKTLASQKRRMLLTSRQLLQAKALDIENDLRGTLASSASPILDASDIFARIPYRVTLTCSFL